MMRRTISVHWLLLAAVLCLAACATAPVTALNYRCVLPKTTVIDVDPDLATAFAGGIAAGAKLQVLSQTRLKGRVTEDVTYIVSLKSSAADGVFVNVLFNQPYRTMALTISGDVQNPEAGVIAQKAVKVFSTMFPGSTLAPFAGNQALFGP
jgi:hypothetical protein